MLAAEPAACCWEEDNAAHIQEIHSWAIWRELYRERRGEEAVQQEQSECERNKQPLNQIKDEGNYINVDIIIF